ncbi:SAV_2336 N-terminal domain-related protein [Streptomyces sp. NPDC051014]|uniref:effector-associated constant component EACC1 n=1 Tax=Streptomyces sp. NPDC051014 TaxID=3155751 RepID=UPI0033E8A34A
MLEDFIHSLQGAGVDIDAVALADALWLCGLAATGDSGAPTSPAAAQPASDAPAHDDEATPDETAQQETVTGSPANRRDVFDSPGGSGSRTAVVGSAGRGTALPDDLALARALRPLRRRFPYGRDLVLDEEATVRAYVETRTLTPVFSPRPERWFHLDLVVDQSDSMQVWQDAAGELLALLGRLGAFRTLHRWSLEARGDGLVLRDPSGTHLRPDRLKDPHGRRLVVVFSDCVDDGWHAPPVWQALRTWAGSTAAVLLNPLPPRLWPHTGLDAAVVPLAPAGPGARGADLGHTVPAALRMLAGPDAGGSGDWLPCPVSGFSAASLGAWARTVMATGTDRCEGVLIPPGGRLTDADDDADEADLLGWPDVLAASASSAAQQLVRSFRNLASPPAVRLAVLCSPYTDVSLPLLRAVQEMMEPDSGVAELAEVVVSGLFERAPGSRTGDIRLRFRPGVREELRQELAAEDAWRVSRALNHFKERETARRPHPVTIAADHGDIRLADGTGAFTTTAEEAQRPREAPVPDTVSRPTVAILAAQTRAYEAVRDRLTGIEQLVCEPTGTLMERGRLPATPWHVVLVGVGVGPATDITALVEWVNASLNAEAVFSIGVAGALKENVSIGDVVIATSAYSVHSGKRNSQESDGLVPRADVVRGSGRLEQAARAALRGEAYRTHFAPIALGDIVPADATIARRHVVERYKNAVAIEMDGVGVVQAASLNGRLGSLIIRGISDTADTRNEKQGAWEYQRRAMRNAADAAVAVLRELRPSEGLPYGTGPFSEVPAVLPSDDGGVPGGAEPHARWPGEPAGARIVVIAGGRTPVLGGSKIRQMGTGFLLSPRLILTSAHVVPSDPGEGVIVRGGRGALTTAGWYDCQVLWRSDTDGAALLLTGEDIDDPSHDRDFATPRWAQLAGGEQLTPCHVTGAVLTDSTSSGVSGHLTGTLHSLSSHPHWAYEFEPTSPLPASRRTKALERGLSGAPVFFGDFLLGFCVSLHVTGSGALRLAIAGVGGLMRHSGFADACSRYMLAVPFVESLPNTPPAPVGGNLARDRPAAYRSPQVFISYAHEDDDGVHAAQVRRLWELLCAAGIDARLDQSVVAEASRNWTAWMRQEMETADLIVVVASPAYKRRAESRAADASQGVAFESRLLRDELAHLPADRAQRIVSVVLPGNRTDDLPAFLTPSRAVTVKSVTRTGVEHLVRRLTQHPLAHRTDPAEEAHRCIGLAGQEWETGFATEALDSVGRAIEIYRSLAADSPAVHQPDLVRALTAQSDFLAALGHSSEALQAAHEALSVIDGGRWAGPDGLHAKSLSTFGNRLADLGRHQEALVAVGEAVTLCRHLTENDADAFLPDLAILLNSQSAALRAAGRPAEAVDAAREAVLIGRRLAETHPAADLLPGLASSLLTMSAALSEAISYGEALAAAEEAVALCRQLPRPHGAPLAAALHHLGLRLSEVGRTAEALEAMDEAVTLRRRLAATDFHASVPDLAQSLSAAASIRIHLGGDLGQALDEAREAVEILRGAGSPSPPVLVQELNRALSVQAAALERLGRWAEAERIYRSLAQLPQGQAADVQIRTKPDDPEELESLLVWLREESGFRGTARLVAQPASTGLVGAATLAALHIAGPATAFLSTALATWLVRRRSARTTLEVTMPDGRKATVSAARPDAARAALESLLGQEE